ncbi:hypothetical protein Ahy_B08g093820 isoform C [Arachis hypogaea]|uniref:Uncharacterized protein n=1 Tax=Arachis hypogaea TaxID=3818 RepID=A0A444Y7A3_ARAHY|nr:hypothetical protein Ahy_B08g093820 isoform C [Arachis hypogaea]
MFSLKLVL